MHSRFLSGWRVLFVAAVATCLVVAPATGLAAEKKPTSIVGPNGSGAGLITPTDPDQVKKPTLFVRSNYVWPYPSGPTYGIGKVPRDQWSKPGMLHTSVGSFDLSLGLPAFPAELTTTVRFGELGAQYFFLQVLPGADFENLRESIAAAGGEFVQAVAVGGHIVRMTPDAYAAASGQPGVNALFPYHPAFKLSPLIGRAALPDPATALSEVYKLSIALFPGEDSATVAQLVANLGANVLQIRQTEIIAELHRDRLPQLAALEPVYSVQEIVPILPHGEETTAQMQIGECGAGGPCLVPYHDAGIQGQGDGTVSFPAQRLAVVDSGISVDGGDLSHTKTTTRMDLVDGSGAHRKVIIYRDTDDFGGNGDNLGCDEKAEGFSHGHAVSATALGWATNVDPSYIDDGSGAGYQALDDDQNPWSLDGVAPQAKLVFYDAYLTPPTGPTCDDPQTAGGLSVGTLYSRPTGGSMYEAYHTYDARTWNFSFGGAESTYGTGGSGAQAIDQFLFDHRDAMVFTSAGNGGDDADSDGIPDRDTVTDPATCKNCIPVGGSGNSNDTGGGGSSNSRWFGSSVGPATTSSNRMAPLIMAPGTDFGNIGNMGVDSEFSCTTLDNASDSDVECDIVAGLSGTSFASPAAAGAGMIVMDYYSQGFYPDRRTTNPGNNSDKTCVSGMLVKATLIASADFMTGGNLWEGFRGNVEQGYGHIKLDNVLPLETWSLAPSGLVVEDQAGGTQCSGPQNTDLGAIGTGNTSTSHTFKLQTIDEELRIACAWIEDAGDTLTNDIDLTLTAPNGTVYLGNVFTEDNDRNDIVDAGEDCIDDFDVFSPVDGEIDEGAWSIPDTADCTPVVDDNNPFEAIMLSPDPKGDSADCFNEGRCDRGGDDPDTTTIDEGDDNQIQLGDWTLTLNFTGTANPLDYACVIAGPVALGSSVRFDAGGYVCNELATITVNETDPTADNDTHLETPPSGTKADEVARRTTLYVKDSTGAIRDQECIEPAAGCSSGLTFTQPDTNALRFVLSDLNLTSGTGRAATATYDNGAIDVRSGDLIEVVYEDETNGTTDAEKRRRSTAIVDCDVSIAFGGIVWSQFGKNSPILIEGGCERDARGRFTFGFPDKHMDAGELIGYRMAMQSTEPNETLVDAEVTLKCVDVDTDSPEDCKPGTDACDDPNRNNNARCDEITVLDPVKRIGELPPSSAVSVNFTLQVADSITGTPDVEMVASISAKKAGKPVGGTIVSRHTLDVDEKSVFYSTDYPDGGVQTIDWTNDEIVNPESCTIDVPCTEAERGIASISLDFEDDYRFETMQWSDLKKGGKNPTIQSPWDFDTTNGGFTVGLHGSTDLTLSPKPANWGEDFNFNNQLDGTCAADPEVICFNYPTDPVNCPFGDQTCNEGDEDRDPPTDDIENNWSTAGGCGWQTNGGSGTGGVWHTGTIRSTVPTTCLAGGDTSAKCQSFETAGAPFPSDERFWMETLKTPEFEKVNGDDFTVEFLWWAWNASLDLPDDNSFLMWELDTDLDKIEFDIDNFPVLNYVFGEQGAISGGNAPLTDGHPVFASTYVCQNDGSTVCASNETCTKLEILGTCVGDPNPGDGTAAGTCDTTGGGVGGVACDVDDNCLCVLDPSGVGQNGIAGNNRVGQDNCYFEENTAILPLGLALPEDDDFNQDEKVCSDPSNLLPDGFTLTCSLPSETGKCVGTCVDNKCDNLGLHPCAVNADCNFGSCTTTGGDTNIDEFVTPAGPIRNFDISHRNGSDMRFSTLEDIYGDSGSRFEAGLGFLVIEGTASINEPISGFGASIDDMVIEWREYQLAKDATECDPGVSGGNGQCAAVEIENSNLFEGSQSLTVRVVDPFPYGSGSPTCTPGNGTSGNCNDCNGDGDFIDAGIDDADCNDNGTDDVTARVTSESLDVEIVALDLTDTAGAYAGVISISTTYDVDPGVLFIQPEGTDNPTVRVQYNDRNDGTGNICQNSVDPEQAGTVESASTVFISRGTVVITAFDIQPSGTNADTDQWPDTNETVELRLTLDNKTNLDLNDVSLRLSTNDTDKIDCIITPFADVGTIGADSSVTMTDPFVFRVRGDVNRTSLNEELAATFNVTLKSDKFEALLRGQEVVIDLDLNVTDPGAGATTFSEGFESNSIDATQFQAISLDELPPNLAGSDGHRCQYSDPTFPNSNTYPDREHCFLGFVNTSDNQNDWHLHKSKGGGAAPDGGRAHGGGTSVHWGFHTDSNNPDLDTLRLKQLDTIRTDVPVNLDPTTSSQLRFWQQVSLMDSGHGTVLTNTPGGQVNDRVAVMLRLADQTAGTGIGDWIKIYPYENIYDLQASDVFSNCFFDPTDDGTTEDDFFDPEDPNRRLGPSTTCFPEFSWGWQGDTDHGRTFSSANTGNASDPELFEDTPAIDRGTWMRTSFDLTRFRGRRVFLRFLGTTTENVDNVSYIAAGWPDGIVEDDGWYIDDVTVTNTLTTEATLAPDGAPNTGFDPCGSNCTSLTPSLTADPTSLGAPGLVTELDASGSSAGRCVDGVLQYQFWINPNNNSTLSEADGDTLLRDWTDNPFFIDAPSATTIYGVSVRCSSAVDPPIAACDGEVANQTVSVTCPSAVTLDFQGNLTVGECTNASCDTSDKTVVQFTTQSVDVVVGNLNNLRNTGVFSNSVIECLASSEETGELTYTPLPGSGAGRYFLARPDDDLCNTNATYGTTKRDNEIPNDKDACP